MKLFNKKKKLRKKWVLIFNLDLDVELRWKLGAVV